MQFTLFRYYCGAFVTSLEMSGFSISVLKLSPETRNVILDCLDSPAETLGWTSTSTGILDIKLPLWLSVESDRDASPPRWIIVDRCVSN